jgi:hypothetical protein
MSDILPPAPDEGPLVPAAPTVAIIRRPPEPPRERTAFAQHLVGIVKNAKQHWEPDFRRIRRDMGFASGMQYHDQAGYDDERYRLNIILRHIRLRTAQLYAKNPKAVYRRKPRLDFAVWDEKPESLMMAQQAVALAQQAAMGPPADPMTGAPMPPPPDRAALMQAAALLDDYRQGSQHRALMDRVGRTLELLWDYFIDEPTPNTKIQMKAMVRRAITCGVGYTKLRYQSMMVPSPDSGATIADLTQQMAALERLRATVTDPDMVAECERDREALRQAMIALQSQEQVMAREGPLLDFPRTTSIIPDPATRSLRGWIGSGWVAEEFELPGERVQEIYRVDLADMAARASVEGERPRITMREGKPHIRFWQVYHLETRRLYTVAEGWPDYLEEPRAPEVDVEQFFPYYALTLNDIEHEKRVFPPSDVELLRSVQDEYNRTREALRQHRIANRPLYVAANGAFDKEDVTSLSRYDAHDVVKLNNLKEGQNVAELLQPVPKVPIDPAAYETESLYSDAQRVTGSQEANLGGVSGASATEVSVAEGSRMATVSSDTDEIDEVLTDIARDFGKVCLAMLPAETVKGIVGPGAAWPEFSRGEIMAEVGLTVEAGSSGRPNRERDLANLERALPYVLQIPGIKPEKLARHVLKVMDDKIDLTDWLDPAAPAITAMNRGPGPMATGGGDPSAPDQQGAQGVGNAPNPHVRPPGAQPAFGPSGNPVG